MIVVQPSYRTFSTSMALTIASNVNNYNMKSAAIAAGWNQTTPLILTVTVNSGIYVSSTSNATYAFDTGSGFPAGSALTIINNGLIFGIGGNGGNANGAGPTAGGPALIANTHVSITNNGTIGGGGGGGGAGGNACDGGNCTSAGGGGGGAGFGIGGAPWPGTGAGAGDLGTYGTNGTATTGGGGGGGGAGSGAGGNLGLAGGSGSNWPGGGTVFGQAGAAPGAAVVHIGNVTWLTVGTVAGPQIA